MDNGGGGDSILLSFEVSGSDFTGCGTASEEVKRRLKQLGIDAAVVRKVAIAMYEGEVNMVIHAGGGRADAAIFTDRIEITLTDSGPGIEDIEKAMTEGFSTAGESIRELGFGAGMGLPNMKKYTDGLKIESEAGKGTKVFLRVNF